MTLDLNLPAAKYDAWWATYLKGATFLLPALLLWTAAVIFIVPKLEQICADAGGQPLPVFLQTMLRLTDNGVFLMATTGATIALLELFSAKWARYRRMITGIGVFLVNSVILSSFFALLLTFAVVAPALLRAR